MSVCELITEVERLEKELQTANRRLESARTRLQEVSQDRCQLQAKFNAISRELSPILPSGLAWWTASQPDRDITVPASVVAELRKVLFG
jgi:uncharacterized protein involved in exopolysaccharide biosynthesis